MSAFTTAEAAIAGDIPGLHVAADAYRRCAEEIADLSDSLLHTVDGTVESWTGSAGDAFRSTGAATTLRVHALAAPATATATAHTTLADGLAAARHRVAAAFGASADIGLDAGDLVGRPWAVAAFLWGHPEHAATVAYLLGQVLAARVDADVARNNFVAAVAPTLTAGQDDGPDDGQGGGDRRGVDERGGRRIDNDERLRREEGGSGSGGHFDNDWAGRAILERYLRGGDDWRIEDDPDWTRYMTGNEQLSDQLFDPLQGQAQAALDDYLLTGRMNGDFSETRSAVVENGEGAVGYQYLHGTNSDVGGLGFDGETQVRPQSDGTYEVVIDGSYTWNDVIDPNPQYETDTWKSRFAEIVTLGEADPYDIHVNYEARTIVDAAGDVVSVSGYSGQ